MAQVRKGRHTADLSNAGDEIVVFLIGMRNGAANLKRLTGLGYGHEAFRGTGQQAAGSREPARRPHGRS